MVPGGGKKTSAKVDDDGLNINETGAIPFGREVLNLELGAVGFFFSIAFLEDRFFQWFFLNGLN
jgi:hypothetical protein